MKRLISLSILILFMFSLTGCWDYKDYDDLALVSALGVDMDENTGNITVTVLYYIPGGAGQGNKSQGKKGDVQNTNTCGAVKASGLTIADALDKIQQARRKELFYAYMDDIILGETAAKNIMEQVIRFCDRSPNIRTSSYMVVAKGTAEEVLTTLDPNISVTTGRNIYEMIDQSTKSGSSYPVTIEDFAEKLAIDGTEPVAPRVSVVLTDSDQSSSAENEEGNPYKISTLKEGYQKIDGTAVFKDGHLVGFLNTEESTGLGYITNTIMTPYENVKITPDSGLDDTLIFTVIKCKSNTKAAIENDNPVITVNTNIQVELYKYVNDIPYDDLNPDAISAMETLLADHVKSKIEATIYKVQQEFKTDIFGFGFEFYRSNTKAWHTRYGEEWDDIFPDIQVNVNVNAQIQNTGTNVKKFDLG